MSELASAARLLAFQAGRAVPVSATRRVRLRPDALLLSFLGMAGEHGGTVHAFVAGTADGRDSGYGVPDPRDRDSQFDLFAALAAAVDGAWRRARDAGTHPQLVVTGADAADRLGQIAMRLCRSPRADEDAVALGERLAWFCDRASYPGQQSLVVAASALAQHVATGQAPADDAHLGSLLEWIRPGAGGAAPGPLPDRLEQAELRAAGPSTRPEDDRALLVPALDAWQLAGRTDDQDAQRGAAMAIGHALGPALHHQHRLLRTAAALLGALPLPDLPDPSRPADPRSAVDRWAEADAESFEQWCAHLDRPGHRISFRDTDRAAAFRLAAAEAAHENAAAAAVLGDPVAREDAVLAGTAVRLVLTGVAEGRPAARPGLRRRAVAVGVAAGPLVPAEGETWRQAAPGAPRWLVASVDDAPGGGHAVTLSRPGPDAPPGVEAGAELDLVPAAPDWHAARARSARLHARARPGAAPWRGTPP